MKNIEELIANYSEEENVPELDKLYQRLSVKGRPKEKELLAEAYITVYNQCRYDYMCGKFNTLTEVWQLMEWIEKIKSLDSNFDRYSYYKAHVYEMVSALSEAQSDKLDYKNKSISFLRTQKETNGKDVALLIDLAEHIFEYCILKQEYPTNELTEVKNLFSEALHLERKEEPKQSHFGFNGTSITAFLNTTYQLLCLPIKNGNTFYKDFIAAFKNVMQQYEEEESVLYYYWADSLLRITKWIEFPKTNPCKMSPETVTKVWEELKEVLNKCSNVQSDNEHFLTSIGHLFNTVAEKENSISYYDIAYNYYIKANTINNHTWSNPHYASNALRMKAYILLRDGEIEEATALFKEGLAILAAADKNIADFQLSLHYGNFLYDYSLYIENFNTIETLLEAQKHYKISKELADDYYTQPFYAIAKTALRLKNKKEALAVLKECGIVFSNEYHTHDFSQLIGHPDFKEVQDDLPEIILQHK